MKITIDRTHCDLCQSYCDRHVARLIRTPLGEDRPCIQSLIDDGRPELTLVVQDGDNEATIKALAFQPDSIVMDIRLGNGNGIDACRHPRQHGRLCAQTGRWAGRAARVGGRGQGSFELAV